MVNCLHSLLHPLFLCVLNTKIMIMATAPLHVSPHWLLSQNAWIPPPLLGWGTGVHSAWAQKPGGAFSHLGIVVWDFCKKLKVCLRVCQVLLYFLPFFLSLWQRKYFNIYMGIIFFANVLSGLCECREGDQQRLLLLVGILELPRQPGVRRYPYW